MIRYIQRIHLIECITRTEHIHACKGFMHKMYGAIFLAIISVYMLIFTAIYGISRDTSILTITLNIACYIITISIINREEEAVNIIVGFSNVFIILFIYMDVGIILGLHVPYFEGMLLVVMTWIMYMIISLCYGIIYYHYTINMIRTYGLTLSHHQHMTIMRTHPTFTQYIHPPIPSRS